MKHKLEKNKTLCSPITEWIIGAITNVNNITRKPNLQQYHSQTQFATFL